MITTVSEPLRHQPQRVSLSCLHEWLPNTPKVVPRLLSKRWLRLLGILLGNKMSFHPDGRHLASRIATGKARNPWKASC